MKLTARSINTLGFAGIAVMAVMLALLWFRIVPDSMTVPFFILALALFLTRLVLRVLLVRKEREALRTQRQKSTSI